MTVITLLSDFGLRDGYPGVMKGVIWKIAPEVQIADISHSIDPQNIFQGALALSRTAPFFPPGTIHVAIVDPGVGTLRRPVGLQLGEHYFIGPDNGLFTLVLEHAESAGDIIQVFHLDQSSYWLPNISRVFHGRDVFAPVAAHLAHGIPLEKMGSLIHDPVRLEIPQPEPIQGGGWRGQVIEIDTFGNLSTNIDKDLLTPLGDLQVHVGGQQINGLVGTFGDRPPGTLIALYGTTRDLVISIVNGNAAHALNISMGDKVEVYSANRATYQ
jgi:S-adenosyl-L-methionine hydrolase (adenosine-forming)